MGADKSIPTGIQFFDKVRIQQILEQNPFPRRDRKEASFSVHCARLTASIIAVATHKFILSVTRRLLSVSNKLNVLLIPIIRNIIL